MSGDILFESPLPPPWFDFGQVPLSSRTDTYFDVPTPSMPQSETHAAHSPGSPGAITVTVTITVTPLASASQPVTHGSFLNKQSLHELVEAINLSIQIKSSDLTNDSSLQTPLQPPSPTTTPPLHQVLLKTPCISPVHLQKANMTVSHRIQAEKKSPLHDFHEQRIERELQPPSPEPTIRTSIANDELDTSSQDTFSLRSSIKEDSTTLLNNNELELPASTNSETQKPDSSKPFPYSSHYLPGAVYQDSDTESVTSRSTFSEESLPDIVAPPIVLPCNIDEAALFDNVFHVLDDAWSDFEAKCNESFEPLPSQEMVLRLPSFHAAQVLYGLRPDYSGCWKGFIHLNGRYSSLEKLLDNDFKNGFIYGVRIGGIRDVDGYGGAIVFTGQDRKVYYTSEEGWFEEDDEGFYEFLVHGGFDIRQFRMTTILDI